MIKQTKELGDKGEDFTAQWLEKQGFTICARNYRKRWGEIDVVASKDELLVFVEVKTRKDKYFPISETVTYSKQKKLIRTAHSFVLEHNIQDKVLRFDIAALTSNGTHYEMTYIPNAFN
ncbi:YraN family protein [Candidatus Babeliales bacterium]|nr:YraN family protein [Candidatus Babeliales bacterium]